MGPRVALTDLAFSPEYLASYRWFRAYGLTASHAMELATKEVMLKQLIASDEYRVEWEYDDQPLDVSWAPEDEQAQYKKELKSGVLSVQGVTLKKRNRVALLPDEFHTVDSCWGIFIYTKNEGAECRYHQAEILSPFAT